jgi:hypothetical protein
VDKQLNLLQGTLDTLIRKTAYRRSRDRPHTCRAGRLLYSSASGDAPRSIVALRYQ